MDHPLPGTRHVAPAESAAPAGPAPPIGVVEARTATPGEVRGWNPPSPIRAVKEQGVAVGMLAITAVLVWGVGVIPGIHPAGWALRAAFTLLVVAVGVPTLWALRRTRHRLAALFAGGFLIVGLAAAAVSDDPLRSLFGAYGWSTGWIAMVGFVSAWALGTALLPRWVGRIETTILVVAVANAVVAIVQTAFQPSIPSLEMVTDRAAGLTGNPVYLGGLLAAAAGIAVARSRPWVAAGFASVFGFAAMTTASRAAVMTLVLIAAYALWRHRWLRGAAIATVMAAAMVGGAFFTSATTLEQRSSDAARVDIWILSLDALEDEPVLGFGPGLFRDAITPRRSLDHVAAQSTEAEWVDAHNVVVEYGVTTGLIGVALLAVWLALAGLRARGPLAVFALVIFGAHLLQPQSLVLTTLGLLALGAAMPRTGVSPPTVASWIGIVPAVFVAIALVTGAFYLDRGRVDFDIYSSETAARILSMYPDPAVAASRAHALHAIDTRDPADAAEAVRWREIAIDRDSTNAFLWQGLGEIHLSQGRPGEAMDAFDEALRHDPWLRSAHVGIARAAVAMGDAPIAERHITILRSLGMDEMAETLQLEVEDFAG